MSTRQVSDPVTLLIVDSDLVHRDWMSRTLRSQGYRVLEARSSSDATNLFHRHASEIALLITAIALPEGNGYELATSSRATQPQVIVLYVSGTTGALLGQFYGGQTQGGEILFRPFGATALIEKVKSLFESGRSNTASL